MMLKSRSAESRKRYSNKELLTWHVIGVVLSLFWALVFFSGVLLLGTESELVSFVYMYGVVLYLLFVGVCISLSRKKGSLGWALVPVLIPVALFVVNILVAVVGGIVVSILGR